jgi:hypothetical protein
VHELDLVDFTAEHVAAFVAFLERTRGNGIGTRNARLAALHTFARFVATEHPERLAEVQRGCWAYRSIAVPGAIVHPRSARSRGTAQGAHGQPRPTMRSRLVRLNVQHRRTRTGGA